MENKYNVRKLLISKLGDEEALQKVERVGTNA